MRTPALLLAFAWMCVARLPGQDSTVTNHDSTIPAHDSSCTYERCALEFSSLSMQLFAGPLHTPLPLETLLTNGNSSVKAEYTAYRSDEKVVIALGIVAAATMVVQGSMFDAAREAGDLQREKQVFPFIGVPLAFMGGEIAEGISARHHLKRAVELYNDDLPRLK